MTTKEARIVAGLALSLHAAGGEQDDEDLTDFIDATGDPDAYWSAARQFTATIQNVAALLAA